jgi:hypothetical protein
MKKTSTYILVTLILLIVSSFDLPKGWYKAGAAPDDYEMGIDPGSGQSGGNAGTIKSKKDKAKSWGTLMQDFAPGKFLGKKIRMIAFMKTKDVSTSAAFWLRVDQEKSRASLSFDNMANRAITGNTEWTKYEIVLDVPEKASNIAYGAMLRGSGQIWFDNFSFAVDTITPVTDLKKVSRQNAEPYNVDFEK